MAARDMGTFTNLSASDMTAIAAAFGLGDVREFGSIAAGTVNSNFWLDAARARYFLRVNEGKSERDVRYEADLISALAAAGVPTPEPLATASGQRYLSHGGHLISAFPWVPGHHRDDDAITAEDARALGAALAALHRAGLPLTDRFERAGIYTFSHICARADGLFGSHDVNLSGALGMIQDEISWLSDRAALRSAVPHGIIHGDLFPDNVLFERAAVTALLDFEQACSGSLIYDLAVSINAWCYREGFFGDVAWDRVQAMVDGYQQIRAITPAESRALSVELRAAAMRFTVTRITDVYLPGVDQPTKDFRLYAQRLQRWREVGADGLLDRVGLGQ